MQLQKQNHMTIFLTTHYMEETNHADYVVIMDEGKIVAKGTPLQLKNRYTYERFIIYTQDHFLKDDIKSWSYEMDIYDDYVVIHLHHTMEAYQILQQCQNKKIDFEVIKGTMEDVFIAVTGKG